MPGLDGVTQIDLFIPGGLSGGFIAGDGREFTSARNKSSRVRFTIDHERGQMRARIEGSCLANEMYCPASRPIVDRSRAWNIFHADRHEVSVESNTDQVTVQFDVINSVTAEFGLISVDGRITVSGSGGSVPSVGGNRDPYPAIEAYFYGDNGRVTTLLQNNPGCNVQCALPWASSHDF